MVIIYIIQMRRARQGAKECVPHSASGGLALGLGLIQCHFMLPPSDCDRTTDGRWAHVTGLASGLRSFLVKPWLGYVLGPDQKKLQGPRGSIVIKNFNQCHQGIKPESPSEAARYIMPMTLKSIGTERCISLPQVPQQVKDTENLGLRDSKVPSLVPEGTPGS